MPSINSNDKKGQVIPFLLDSSFFYKKGIEAYEQHRLDRAIYYIEKAMILEPEEPVFPCQLAIFLSEKGQYSEANHLLEKIVNELDEMMFECYFFMANNYAHLGEFDQAIHYLNLYLLKEPEGEFLEDAHSLLFMLEEEYYDEWEDALSDEHEMSQFEHILEPLHKGDFALAEKEARMTIGETPEEWDVYAYLAEALIQQGNFKEAKSILQNLLAKSDSNFLARCIYTSLLVKEGNSSAEHWVKNLENLHPISEWHCYYLAKTLFLIGQYKKASQWYEKLASQYSFNHSPIFLHQRAIAAWKNGRNELAINLWEKVKRLDKNNEGIAEHFIKLVEGKKLVTYSNEQLLLFTNHVATK